MYMNFCGIYFLAIIYQICRTWKIFQIAVNNGLPRQISKIETFRNNDMFNFQNAARLLYSHYVRKM